MVMIKLRALKESVPHSRLGDRVAKRCVCAYLHVCTDWKVCRKGTKVERACCCRCRTGRG